MSAVLVDAAALAIFPALMTSPNAKWRETARQDARRGILAFLAALDKMDRPVKQRALDELRKEARQ